MNTEEIRKARRADLSAFLLSRHRNDVVVTGQCVYLKAARYVYTKKGYSGFVDYHTNESGNSIDLLVKYLGYSFRDAVTVLSEYDMPSPAAAEHRTFELPHKDKRSDSRVREYLQYRGIPQDTIEELISSSLLYQDSPYGNAVFVSRIKDFCEIRGTDREKVFHGIRRKRPDCFWSYRNSAERIMKAYICEAAIDAVSLAVLHKRAGITEPSAYISIGGAANQSAVDRISRSVQTIIAADNDQAGEQCRQRNRNLPALIPVHKDWNEDLMNNEYCRNKAH